MELEEVRTTLHHHQGMYDTIPPCQSIEDCKRHSFVITMEEKEREREAYIYIFERKKLEMDSDSPS